MTTTRAAPDLARLRALPKAEVHVHLEGAFEPATLERWANQAGVAMPRPRERLFAFDGLADFLHFLDWACALADRPERLADIARDFALRLRRDGTGYADAIFNPTHWGPWHGRLRAMLDAFDAGFAEAEQDGAPRIGLCVSLLRTQSAQQAAELVESLVEWRHPRVVALSVDGNEAAVGRTGPRFAEAFRRAAAAGLKRTVHAGESSGPDGVRDAIEWLGADRIDHGVRAAEDPALVAELAERGIPLGVCPTSNLVLKVYRSMAEHPIDKLRRAGVRVSINTDDPSLLGTTLPDEYARCVRAFGWGDAELREVAATSIDASFADDDTRRRLHGALAACEPVQSRRDRRRQVQLRLPNPDPDRSETVRALRAAPAAPPAVPVASRGRIAFARPRHAAAIRAPTVRRPCADRAPTMRRGLGSAPRGQAPSGRAARTIRRPLWSRALPMPHCTAHRCIVGAPPRAALRSSNRPAPASPRGPARWRSAGCACGGSCPRCRGEPVRDDPVLEREADAVARRIAPTLQGAPPGGATPSGTPLPPAVAARLSGRLAVDVAAVRLHAGDAGARTSRALGARAYTVGEHIVFGRGQYRPDRPEGRHLLGHELAHVAQQRRTGVRVQRSPYDPGRGSDDIHRPLAEDYARQAGDGPPPFSPGALPYTEGYRRWLQAQTAPGPRFLPPTFTQKDPLQQVPVAASGLTTYSINGRSTAGLPSLGDVIATVQGQLTPARVVTSPGLVAGQTQCRFDPAQPIDSAAHVDELTPPPAGGWRARLAPAAVGAAAACPGKADVPVTLTDASGDPARLARLVHDSEMEHVGELRALHDRHFVPYHRFVMGLSATAGSAADCEAQLRARIAERDAQAAIAFVLGDLAATRRYDDPASTHHGRLTPTVSPGCSAVTLTARQVNPPRPGAGPGNVMPVAPRVTAVDPAALSVSGSTLMSGASVVRAFASAADATTAMGVFAALGVTEIRRIGPVELLFAGAQAAIGSLVSGLAPLHLHPDRYQVSVGMPNVADWVISEMNGARFLEIANFGAARDEAYAAAALMVGQAIARRYRIGPAGGAGMTFYTAA